MSGNRGEINYFSLFEIPESFEIDSVAFRQKYFDLQEQFHPDRVKAKPEQERISSLQKSADINEGYNVLKDPLLRAEHLLSIRGVKDIEPSKEFLSEMMDFGEILEELGNDEAIDNFIDDLSDMLENTFDEFSKSFATQEFDKAAYYMVRAKFLTRLIENAEMRRDSDVI